MKAASILLLATAASTLAGCSLHGDSGQAMAATAAQAPVALSGGYTIMNASPAQIGMTVAGELVKQGSSNFYRFDNPGKLRDIVLVRLDNRSTTLLPEIRIYNADRSLLFDRYDGTRGANVEQKLSLDPGQSIYVEVVPYGTTDGAYQLSAIAQKAYDVNEANDSVLTPTTVKFGSSIEGSVMDDKDSDWYHFTAASSPKVTIALENLSAELRPDVKVYSASKSGIMEKYDGTPGAGLDFTVDVPAGQDFYVEVVPFGNSNGKYRLSARGAVMAADMAYALKTATHVDLYGVYFDADQAFVKPESADTLSEVASLLKADPMLRLEISGHTDDAGTKDHNATLSQGRADAVVAALVGQYGIDPNRLAARGYGDSKPLAPNDNVANMAKNRRVELRRI